jgi:hypothetical protein
MQGVIRHGHAGILPEYLQTKYAIRNIEKLSIFIHKRAYRPRKISSLVAGPVLEALLNQFSRVRTENCLIDANMPHPTSGSLSCSTSTDVVRSALSAARKLNQLALNDEREHTQHHMPGSARAIGERLVFYVGDDPTLTALLSIFGLLGKDGVGWWPDYSDKLVVLFSFFAPFSISCMFVSH